AQRDGRPPASLGRPPGTTRDDRVSCQAGARRSSPGTGFGAVGQTARSFHGCEPAVIPVPGGDALGPEPAPRSPGRTTPRPRWAEARFPVGEAFVARLQTGNRTTAGGAPRPSVAPRAPDRRIPCRFRRRYRQPRFHARAT